MDNSSAAFGPFGGTTPAAVNVVNIHDYGGSGSDSKYIFGGGFGVVVFLAVLIFTIFKYKKKWGCGCSFSCKGSCQISSCDACVAHSKNNADKRKIASAKDMRKRLGKLKVEMENISKEQQSIKEGQSQVRAKFNEVEEEYEQLRNETNEIIRQTANTQLRLGLMFSILKAREQGDLGKAAQLTALLREMVGIYNSCEGGAPPG